MLRRALVHPVATRIYLCHRRHLWKEHLLWFGMPVAYVRDMKTLRPLVALSLLITLSASKCEKKGGGSAADLGGSRWNLQTLNTEQFQMAEGLEVPYLELDPSGSTVSGKAGCNKIHGQLKVDGSAISFPGLMGTKMACPAMDVETKFMMALNNTNTFALDGDKLTLLDKSKELATLMR